MNPMCCGAQGKYISPRRHDFWCYEPDVVPAQINHDRMALNRVLCGEETALNALLLWQPDPGRKIRKNANVAASMICTFSNG